MPTVSQERVLTFDEAYAQSARATHPQLQVAHAQSEVADARAYESRRRLLPQVTGNASYQRTQTISPSGGGSNTSSTGSSTAHRHRQQHSHQHGHHYKSRGDRVEPQQLRHQQPFPISV